MSSEIRIETQQRGTTENMQTTSNAQKIDIVGNWSVQESSATVNTVKDTSQGTTVPIILGMMS